MGLDFSGFYLKKGETLRDLFELPYNEYNLRELFYARKGWELVYALNCDTNNTCESKLRLEDWINLMEILSPMAPYFDEIYAAYETDDDSERGRKLRKVYEDWHDTNFRVSPQLGYEFSIGYMQEFWEAGDKVLRYLEDPDYEVWMVASY